LNNTSVRKINYEPLACKKQITNSSDLMTKHEFNSEQNNCKVSFSLNSPWAVSKVLTQSKEKANRKRINKIKESNKFEMNAQMKEAIFLKRINQLEEEQRRIQLKGEVRLGEQLVDEATKMDILTSRSKATRYYYVRVL
jgi:hypothetical protein